MSSSGRKSTIITFKADAAVSAAMCGVENRSEFIRAAIMAAVSSKCPLCNGSGSLTPAQTRHWEVFKQAHELAECTACHARHLVCSAATAAD